MEDVLMCNERSLVVKRLVFELYMMYAPLTPLVDSGHDL